MELILYFMINLKNLKMFTLDHTSIVYLFILLFIYLFIYLFIVTQRNALLKY